MIQVVVVGDLHANELPYAVGSANQVANLFVADAIAQVEGDVLQRFFRARLLVGDALVAVAIPAVSDGRTDGWMDGWMDGWIDESMERVSG